MHHFESFTGATFGCFTVVWFLMSTTFGLFDILLLNVHLFAFFYLSRAFSMCIPLAWLWYFQLHNFWQIHGRINFFFNLIEHLLRDLQLIYFNLHNFGRGIIFMVEFFSVYFTHFDLFVVVVVALFQHFCLPLILHGISPFWWWICTCISIN